MLVSFHLPHLSAMETSRRDLVLTGENLSNLETNRDLLLPATHLA